MKIHRIIYVVFRVFWCSFCISNISTFTILQYSSIQDGPPYNDRRIQIKKTVWIHRLRKMVIASFLLFILLFCFRLYPTEHRSSVPSMHRCSDGAGIEHKQHQQFDSSPFMNDELCNHSWVNIMWHIWTVNDDANSDAPINMGKTQPYYIYKYTYFVVTYIISHTLQHTISPQAAYCNISQFLIVVVTVNNIYRIIINHCWCTI